MIDWIKFAIVFVVVLVISYFGLNYLVRIMKEEAKTKEDENSGVHKEEE